MAKDAFYFSHDYNARNDRKLVRLAYKYGMAGLGSYWCLVEMLYEEGGYLMLSECECIANELRADKAMLSDIINSDLFKNDGEYFWSETILIRLNKRTEKSEMARNSAMKRWGNANAMPTQCQRNAIKERKGKERKGNIHIPYQDVINKFNEICISLPKVTTLNESRKNNIKKRWNGSIDSMLEVFKAVEASDFLTGRSGAWTGCSFDWILKPANYIKIQEGNYYNRPKNNAKDGKSGRLPTAAELADEEELYEG